MHVFKQLFANKFLKTILLVPFIWTVSCGCGYTKGEKEHDDFVSQKYENREQVLQVFNSYPIEKQIDIYLYARRCPDNPQIQSLLVSNGERKISAIVERITFEKEALNKYYLLYVLEVINNDCNCIKKDSDLVKTLVEDDKKMAADKTLPKDSDTYKEIYGNNLKSFLEELK